MTALSNRYPQHSAARVAAGIRTTILTTVFTSSLYHQPLQITRGHTACYVPTPVETALGVLSSIVADLRSNNYKTVTSVYTALLPMFRKQPDDGIK